MLTGAAMRQYQKNVAALCGITLKQYIQNESATKSNCSNTQIINTKYL